jgi:hypothetical protein
MPVPPIGNVITPTDFVIMSAQGQVYLTWTNPPLTNIYYINRSLDNITFTNVGSTIANTFSDTTGIVGTVYYYTIQASNGTNSSPPTLFQVGQSLIIGTTTVGNLILEAQQRTNRENFDNITIQEWTSMISQSYKWLYNLLIQKFGDDYFIAPPYSYTTTGQLDPVYQAQVFPLPPDFYKLMRCEVALNPEDPNSWVTLRQFQAIQANLWNFPNVYTFYGITNLRYRLWGSQLQIVPIASAGQTIRIWYSPRPSQLINLTDTVDGISAFEELMIVDVCIKALAKTEEDPTIFILQKKELLQEIEEAAENRNVGEPQVVSDSRTRNFAWTDSGGEFGNGSGMW